VTAQRGATRPSKPAGDLVPLALDLVAFRQRHTHQRENRHARAPDVRLRPQLTRASNAPSSAVITSAMSGCASRASAAELIMTSTSSLRMDTPNCSPQT